MSEWVCVCVCECVCVHACVCMRVCVCVCVCCLHVKEQLMKVYLIQLLVGIQSSLECLWVWLMSMDFVLLSASLFQAKQWLEHSQHTHTLSLLLIPPPIYCIYNCGHSCRRGCCCVQQLILCVQLFVGQ